MTFAKRRPSHRRLSIRVDLGCNDVPRTGHEGDVSSDHDRFRRVYAETFEPLLAYAMRRVEQRADAADVVAETFLTAWRRRAELPGDSEVKLWLFGVARRVLANHHRGGACRDPAAPHHRPASPVRLLLAAGGA